MAVTLAPPRRSAPHQIAWHREVYRALRAQIPDDAEATAALIKLVYFETFRLPPSRPAAPPPEELRGLVRELWEPEWVAECVAAISGRSADEVAADAWVDALRWKTIVENAHTSARTSPQLALRLVPLERSYMEALARAKTHQAEADAAEVRHEGAERYRERYRTVYEDLMRTYRELGPHYVLLVERLAHHAVLFEQMVEAGLGPEDPTYRDMLRAHVELTNQLQKFTEASKQEVRRTEIHEAIAGALEVVEQIVAPSYPQLWRTLVGEVRRKALGAPEDGN